MPPRSFRNYLVNCFWLMLPPLAISGLLSGLLPPVFQPDMFWLNIPAIVAWPETLSRVLITGLPLLMPLAMATSALWLVGIGLIGSRSARWLRLTYAVSAGVFLICHNAHTLIVHARYLPG